MTASAIFLDSVYVRQNMVLKNLLIGQQWRNRQRMTYGPGERGGEGEMYGKSNMETYIIVCKIDGQREFAVWLRKLKQGLCINLEGKIRRKMRGSFKREGIYVYLWLFDRKQQNSVKQLSFNKKFILKKVAKLSPHQHPKTASQCLNNNLFLLEQNIFLKKLFILYWSIAD